MTSNPMSEASKVGLLKRMHADKADTFAKKVKWVSKHIPTITDPQAYVGWLTREERSKMTTRKRNPEAGTHLKYAKNDLEGAKEELKSLKDESDPKYRMRILLSAYATACSAISEADHADDPLTAAKGVTLRNQIQTKILAMVPAKAKNPEGATRKITKTGSAREEARFRAERKRLASYRMTPKRTSDHNYVVCDQHGVAIALTTTLAEARKIAPKGGCVQKI